MAEWFPEGTPTEEGASLKHGEMYFAYVLRSLKDGTHYYGSTSDMDKRLQEHNSGKVKYTKGHRPYVLHHIEQFETKEKAGKRERFFKTIAGYNWLKQNKII